jgi:hypothetical protein
MSDPSTSLMLLLRKAGRKIHKNAPLDAQVERWLADCLCAYEVQEEPHWFILAAEANDPSEPVVFLIAVIQGAEVNVRAGRGEPESVHAFCASAPGSPSLLTERAGTLFEMQPRAVRFSGTDAHSWLGQLPGERDVESRRYQSLPVPMIAPAPPHSLDARLVPYLARAAGDNTRNLLTATTVRKWLAETLADLRVEQVRFPDEAMFPGWNLLAADGERDELAMFALAIFYEDGIKLCAGRGEREPVLEFGDEIDDETSLIDVARERFDVAEGEVRLDADETNHLIG